MSVRGRFVTGVPFFSFFFQGPTTHPQQNHVIPRNPLNILT